MFDMAFEMIRILKLKQYKLWVGDIYPGNRHIHIYTMIQLETFSGEKALKHEKDNIQKHICEDNQGIKGWVHCYCSTLL